MNDKTQTAPGATENAVSEAAAINHIQYTTVGSNGQDLLSAALSYAEAGLSVLPCDQQSKAPIGYLLPKDAAAKHTWNPFKEEIAPPETIRKWFSNGRSSLAIVCGQVSGGLEIIDHDALCLFAPWCELVEDLAPGLLSRLVILRTQSGGRHVAYRCAVVAPNTKLAQEWSTDLQGTPKKETLIETRGEGGYILTCPTEGYTVLQGDLLDIPTITPDERAILLSAARSFNLAADDGRPETNATTSDNELRPGDDFNERGDVLSILEQHGWVEVSRQRGVHLRRPGKSHGGLSATWNYIPRRLYVFSTNAHPFEAEKAYSPFAVYALLEHDGDYTAAARELAIQGYGGQTTTKLLRPSVTTGADEAQPPSAPDLDCPLLPDEARVDPSLGMSVGAWVDTYTDHAGAISPLTPIMFHESAALWLASVVIARRLVLPMHFGSIYPNLFVIWIAPTTLYRKTTSLDVARGIVRRTFPHLMAAQDTTPEAFLSDMAGHEPSNFDNLTPDDQAEWRAGRDYAAQKGCVLDEMSGLLAASGRDYNAGLIEALLTFYDCNPQYTRSTRGQGRIVVRNAYLTMLGASTPAAMAPHLAAERLWGMGWWPRFAILTPEKPPVWQRARHSEEPAELADGLRRLYNRLPAPAWPDPPEATTVTLDDGVYNAWERYSRALSHDLLVAEVVEPQLNGTYGRLPVQALKVATILAALEWPEDQTSPRIGLGHLARAISICEDWRASAHRAIAVARVTELNRLQERVLRQIKRSGTNGATLRDLCKRMKDRKSREIENVLIEMAKMGEIEAIEVRPGKEGGRPTTRYRLTTE